MDGYGEKQNQQLLLGRLEFGLVLHGEAYDHFGNRSFMCVCYMGKMEAPRKG